MKEVMKYVKDDILGSWWQFKDSQESIQYQILRCNIFSNYTYEEADDETKGYIKKETSYQESANWTIMSSIESRTELKKASVSN